MTKEQFIALGLNEEQATKAAEQSAAELTNYIPKTRFDEVNEAKKKADNDLKERDTQLEALKKDATTSEELKAQITTLQEENKVAAEKAATELKDLQMANAIKLAITGKVHDEDMVSSLFDKTKLILQDDGKVTGLDDQLATIKESKAFLFKEENSGGENKPGFKVGGNEPPAGGNSGATSLKDALTAKFAQ